MLLGFQQPLVLLNNKEICPEHNHTRLKSEHDQRWQHNSDMQTAKQSKHFVVHLSHLSLWQWSCQSGVMPVRQSRKAKQANLSLSLVVVVYALELNQSGG